MLPQHDKATAFAQQSEILFGLSPVPKNAVPGLDQDRIFILFPGSTPLHFPLGNLTRNIGS